MGRFLIILIAAAVIVIFPDIYTTRVVLKGSPLLSRVLVWLPTIALGASILLLAIGFHNRPYMFTVFFVLILCFIIPKFLFVLLSVIGRIAGVSKVMDIAGLVIAVLFMLSAGYGLAYGWKKVRVREVELSFDNLPASFDGYRIAQISDWHLGTYTGAISTIREEVSKASGSNTDLIVFTGDIVNGDASEMDPFMEVLSDLGAPDGVVSVMGNHDYCMYSSTGAKDQSQNIAKLQENERSLGWNLLLNDHIVISNGTDSIAVVGVENDGTPPFPQRGDLVKAQDGLPEGMFKVLLSHDPTHWRRSVLPQTDIALTLSGHTHAAQFRIGRISPSRWFYREWGGLYEEGDRKLYVSTGSGGNIPFRFGAWPEVVMITLRKK